MNNFLQNLNTMSGAADFALVCIITWILVILISNLRINPKQVAEKLSGKSLSMIGRKVKRAERNFHRDYEIGVIKRNSKKYKAYTLLNDLTIDLGLKTKGTTPYELLFFILAFSAILTMIAGLILFSNFFIMIGAYPLIAVAFLCALYTRANISHEGRIKAVIEAENIICNNIESGVKVAVRNSIASFPKDVQAEFQDFLHELDDSTYIVTALFNLNDKLGSEADRFISKCVKFELYEGHGTAGTFKDIVEMNNYKIQTRIKMARQFDLVMNEFKICSAMIMTFLFGVLVIYPFIREWYFTSTLGQMLLIIDLALFVAEFVVLTFLRAKDVEHM